MANYPKMYTALFNAATDALARLADGDIPGAEHRLKTAQAACEEMFINSEPRVAVVPRAPCGEAESGGTRKE